MMSTTHQEWHEYNQAQVNEKARFQELLYELCAGLEEPFQHMGRPRLPIADMIFALGCKVYSTFSARRFSTDLREAHQKGYLSKVPSYNSVCDCFQMEVLTPYLKQLIIESSLPLKAIEQDFAVDSSGFSNGIATRWFNAKYTRRPEATMIDWLKVHLMCGVKTHVVTSVEVSERRDHDYKFFQPLVESTARNFQMKEISADKAYSGLSNLRLVIDNGAQPFIPFKKNVTDKHWRSYKDKADLWGRLFRLYQYKQEEFYQQYHKRSNVETVFSQIKSKFGERLRSKTRTAQVNELLCKVLCHNVCCLIQSIYELGIAPSFWTHENSIQ